MLSQTIFTAIEEHLARNMQEYITILGALAIAGICTMPKKFPTSVQEIWEWFRDTLQSATPVTRASSIAHTVVATPNTVTEIKNEVKEN